jgi:hypothetical protein
MKGVNEGKAVRRLEEQHTSVKEAGNSGNNVS